MSKQQIVRVAYFIDSFMIGGTELNALRTLEAIDREQFNFVVFHFGEHGPLRSRYEALGVRMVHVPIVGLLTFGTVRAGFRLGRLLRKEGFSVAHTHDVYANIFVAFWVMWLAGCPLLASRRWFYEVPRPALNILNRWSYRCAKRVLANSASVVRLLIEEERLPRKKIVEIPNFLDDRAFAPVLDDRRSAQRSSWGVPAGAYLVGCVARLVAVKNHAMLLRAVAQLPVSVYAVLVGDGPERAALESLAASLGLAARVRFLGTLVAQDNIHHYFDVSVLCSRSEGFPNAVIEALAARRPVVATRVGGVPDIIDSGVTGVLVESDDVGALIGALVRFIDNPDFGTRLGFAGQAVVRTRYSRDVVISQLSALYEQIAA